MDTEQEENRFERSRSHVTTSSSSSVSSKTQFLAIILICWSILPVLPTLAATTTTDTTTTTLPMTTTTQTTTSTHPMTTTTPVLETTTTTAATTTTTRPASTTTRHTTPTTTVTTTATTATTTTTTTTTTRPASTTTRRTTPTTTVTTTATTATTTATTRPASTTTTTATQFTTTTKPVPTTTAAETSAPELTTLPTTAATLSFAPDPVITSFYPKFGPIAGLTKIGLTGTGFNRIQDINFGASGPGKIDINSRTDVSLTVLTPESNFTGSVNADIVLVGGGGGGGKQLYQQFLYKGNPNITGFNYSKYQLITGGSLLTVLGSNLDSVANPMIRATVTIADREKIRSNESYLQDCRYNDSGSMYCPIPDLNLSRDFIQKLESERESKTEGAASTATASGSVAKLTGPNDTRADIYLGFVLDGLRKYENISDPKAQIANPPLLSFILPPVISSSTDVVTFSKNDDRIYITGKYFQLGCQDSGVQCKVYIGDEMCSSVTVVADNQISCVPPKDRPPTNSNDTTCTEVHANTYAIKVVVGFRVYQYKCLEYFNTNVPLIVGLSVGLGVPVCILVCSLVVCLCLRCRRKKKKTRAPPRGRPLSSPADQIELSEEGYNAGVVPAGNYAHSIGGRESVYPPSRDSEEDYTNDIDGFPTGQRPDAGFGRSLDGSPKMMTPLNDYGDSISNVSSHRETFYPPPREDEPASGNSTAAAASQGRHPPGSSSYGHGANLRAVASSRNSLRSRQDSDYLRRISEHSNA